MLRVIWLTSAGRKLVDTVLGPIDPNAVVDINSIKTCCPNVFAFVISDPGSNFPPAPEQLIYFKKVGAVVKQLPVVTTYIPQDVIFDASLPVADRIGINTLLVSSTSSVTIQRFNY